MKHLSQPASLLLTPRYCTTVAMLIVLHSVSSLAIPPSFAAQSNETDIKGNWIERDDQSFAFASTDRTLPGVALHLIEPATQTYEGQVLGTDGKPAVGAEIWFGGFYGRIPLRERTQTDNDGRYTIAIPDLDDIGNVSWAATAILNNDASPILYRPAPKGVTLELAQGRTLILRAKQTNNQLITNFTAHLEDGRLIPSDRDGKCVIRGLAPRVQYIGLTAPGFVSQYWMMDLYDDQVVEYTHTTEPGGTVSGIVHDEENKPVPWNAVTGRTAEKSIFTVGHSFSNEKGEYRLSGLYLTRKNTVAAFSHRSGDLSYSNDSEVVFDDNTATSQCDFEVTPNHLQPPDPNVVYSISASKEKERGLFRGKVMLPDGNPCTQFRLRLSSSAVAKNPASGYRASYGSIGVAYASPDGTFVFSDVGVGNAFRITISANGYQDQVADPAVGVAIRELVNSEPLDIRLKAAASVRVVVRDVKGNAIEGATVTLHRAESRRMLAPYYKELYVAKGITDRDGVLELPSVALLEGRWLVKANGYPEQQFAFQGELNSTLPLIESVSLTMNFKIAGATEHELALMLVGSDGRILHRKAGIPIENAQWVIHDLLPDRYILRLESQDRSGLPVQFVNGDGNPTSQTIDVQDGAGKSKEFTFDLKGR